jgi:Tol biopolymer transport system component
MSGLARWWRCLAIVTAALFVVACGSAQAKDGASVSLEDFAMSPDGRIVAFQFLGPKGRGVGLYEWQTGKLTHVPNPQETYVGEPSFSYDGKLLALGIQKRTEGAASNIAVVDLATLALTQLTHGDPSSHRIRGTPVFQPGTGDILYVEHGIGVAWHLKLFDVSNGTEKIVLEPKDGFFSIFRPLFVGPEEIYFQATSPVNKDIKKAINDLGVSTSAITVTYRLRFGGTPNILWPELEKSRKHSFQNSISFLSASRDGKTIVGISGAKDYYEIFKLGDDQNLMQLTNLKGSEAFASISYDGSAVAFGFDPMRGRDFDLRILLMQDNNVVSTNLLVKVNASPDFTTH